MNSSYYKYCLVPQCKSTSIKTPKKLFIRVSTKEKTRKMWLKLAGRNDVQTLSTISKMYFCEDHFDVLKVLPNDMLNYTEYHIMGYVSKIYMKPGCTPNKFGCQDDRKKRACSTEPPNMLKKQRMATVAECLKEPEETPSSSLTDTSNTISAEQSETLDDHVGFTCHSCHGAILGFRYSCVECVNFDMCARCEAMREHDHHYMLRVPGPRPEGEFKAVMADLRAALERRAVHQESEVEIKYEPGSDEEDIKPFDPLHVLIGDTKQCGSGVGPCVPTGPAVDPLSPAAPGTAGGAQTPALAGPSTSHMVVAPPGQLAMVVHPLVRKRVRTKTRSKAHGKGEVMAATDRRESTSEQTEGDTMPVPFKMPKQEPLDADSGDTADRPCTAGSGSASKEDDFTVFTTHNNRDEDDNEFDSGVS